MGRFSEKLHNLNLFTEIEESLLNLIKSSFPDTGQKKNESDLEFDYKGLKKSDSDPDFEVFEELTEWQINQ